MLLPEEKTQLMRILELATGITAVMTAIVISSITGMNAYFAYQPAALEADAAQSQLSAGTSSVIETVVCPNETAAQCIARLQPSAIQSATVLPDQGITILTVNTAQAFTSTAGDEGLLSALLQTEKPVQSVANANASTSIGASAAVAPIPLPQQEIPAPPTLIASTTAVATSSQKGEAEKTPAPNASTTSAPVAATTTPATITSPSVSASSTIPEHPTQPTLSNSSAGIQSLGRPTPSIPQTQPHSTVGQPNFIQSLSGSFVIGSFTIVDKIKSLLNL